MSEQRRDTIIGKVLGQFEILEELGRGGMATVYRARQLNMNRIVAVKVLPPHFLHDPGFYERFEREVDVISHLEHPHILPIYDYGQSEGMPYIAMRFLGGGSLEQRIRRGQMALNEIEAPLRQIAQALDYAHRQGIIHRDLKPGNIMMDEAGNAYLSDFGIARVLGSNLTGSMIVGTPAYMSPEQANGLPIDGRSDVYALGVVVFEMLTGHEPYQAETPMAILLKHINEPMPPMSEYRKDIPPSVEAVINKATAKDPDHRYSSATAMVEALANAMKNPNAAAPTEARPPSSAQAVTEPKMDSPTLIERPVETLPVQQSRNGLILIGGLLALFLIVGAVIMLASFATRSSDPAAMLPTPFARASMVNTDQYSISIPNDWMPPGTEYTDASDETRTLHIWQFGSEVFVTLSLVETNTGLDTSVRNYHDQYYTVQELRLLDEELAENGTLRRSYRLENSDRFPPGQMDVFYMQSGGYLTVLETYTADATGNRFVQSLQLVLDSLRVKPQPAQS